MIAGRGFGKTRVGSEWVRGLVCGETPLAAGAYRRMALVAETAADARDVMVEGDSGLLAVHPADYRPTYEPSKRRLTWPNGAQAHLYNGTEPDQLRGPQHDLAWVDELAKFDYASDTWDMLQFGLRLGRRPRQLVTTTPRPIPLIKKIINDPKTAVTRGSTYDNADNLAETFLEAIRERYEGTRLGRQEIDAELLEDLPGALWSRSKIDENRILFDDLPDMVRIVVAVDPSGTDGEDDDGDEIGIIVAGLGVDGRGYVLADQSCKLSPDGWGRRAVNAYYAQWHPEALPRLRAGKVIGEQNFGGAMVKFVIHTINARVAYKEIHASYGKVARAEPISALYEQSRVSHVTCPWMPAGALSKLEDQMCLTASDGYAGEGSPDRMDALVWALTELMITHGGPVRISDNILKRARGR